MEIKVIRLILLLFLVKYDTIVITEDMIQLPMKEITFKTAASYGVIIKTTGKYVDYANPLLLVIQIKTSIPTVTYLDQNQFDCRQNVTNLKTAHDRQRYFSHELCKYTKDFITG